MDRLVVMTESELRKLIQEEIQKHDEELTERLIRSVTKEFYYVKP
jgi:hypothetical protein